MLNLYKNFESLISLNLPKNSTVVSTNLKEQRGSIYVEVHYTVSKEYQIEHELWTDKRILEIRLIKGEADEGLPVLSCAEPDSD